MESTVLGVVLDSSVLIAAERAKLMTPEVINTIWSSIGDLPIVISALTVAELGHGIYRATFSQCMAAHASDFSIVGTANALTNAAFNRNEGVKPLSCRGAEAERYTRSMLTPLKR